LNNPIGIIHKDENKTKGTKATGTRAAQPPQQQGTNTKSTNRNTITYEIKKSTILLFQNIQFTKSLM
jgi:hypothetical protein